MTIVENIWTGEFVCPDEPGISIGCNCTIGLRASNSESIDSVAEYMGYRLNGAATLENCELSPGNRGCGV